MGVGIEYHYKSFLVDIDDINNPRALGYIYEDRNDIDIDIFDISGVRYKVVRFGEWQIQRCWKIREIVLKKVA